MSTQGFAQEALAAAERAADGYEVPVALVRTRARRRRRARTAARAGTALLAVGAVAVVLPRVGVPGVEEQPGAVADFPAEFARCGGRVDPPGSEAVLPDGPFEVDVAVLDDVGGDRVLPVTWRVGFEPDTVTDVGPGPRGEVLLVRDGVVVGVEDTVRRVEVRVEDLPTTGATAPGAVSWVVAGEMVSCDQYPSGRGESRVPAGRYEVVATHSVAWTTPDGAQHTAPVTLSAPVTVTEGPRPTSPEPGACGGPEADLQEVAGPERNPFPVVLDADVPASAPTGGELAVRVRATHEADGATRAAAVGVGVVLTRDGHVVATSVPTAPSEGRTTFPAWEPVPFEASVPLVRCDADDALPAGEHAAWVVLDLRRAGGDRTQEDVQVVGGPWTVTVR